MLLLFYVVFYFIFILRCTKLRGRQGTARYAFRKVQIFSFWCTFEITIFFLVFVLRTHSLALNLIFMLLLVISGWIRGLYSFKTYFSSWILAINFIDKRKYLHLFNTKQTICNKICISKYIINLIASNIA